jgi:4'-phosphopantetheinyl transferase
VATDASSGNRGRLVVGWTSAAAAKDELARLAASFAGADHSEVRVVHMCRSCGSDQHGKPYVIGLDPETPVHVSLSRAGHLAMLAVSDAGPIGIDVEGRRGHVGPPDVATWVRKESVVKATGHGLMIDPDLIDVTPPGSAPSLLVWPGDEPLDSPTWMFDVECPDGYVAAATVLASARPHLVMAGSALEG